MAPLSKAAVFAAIAGTASGLIKKAAVDATDSFAQYAFKRRDAGNETTGLRQKMGTEMVGYDTYGETVGECDCLNWKNVYDRGAMMCGAGYEHEHKVVEGDIPFWAAQLFLVQEVCFNFFTRIDDNVCVNRLQNRYLMRNNPQQWCYVLDSCTGSGTTETLQPGSPVRIKYCNPNNGDRMLWDFTPEELFKFAADYDLDPAQTAKMAYRVEREATWEMSKGMWGQSQEVALSSVETKMQSLMKYIKDVDQYVVLDSKDHHPPFGIVKGGKAWQIAPDPAPDKRAPNTYSQWACVANCDDGTAVREQIVIKQRQKSDGSFQPFRDRN